jgi:hypothetical protein
MVGFRGVNKLLSIGSRGTERAPPEASFAKNSAQGKKPFPDGYYLSGAQYTSRSMMRWRPTHDDVENIY